MKVSTQLGALLLFGLAIGCARSHGAELRCEDALEDSMLAGESCSETFGSCSTGECGTLARCVDGVIEVVETDCAAPMQNCADFVAASGRAGAECSFQDECVSAPCESFSCVGGVAVSQATCPSTQPQLSCEEFMVSNLPLGTACDESVFGRCGGQDENCCGGPELWCEEGRVVAGSLDPCVCQEPSLCTAAVGEVVNPNECEVPCNNPIEGIPCCVEIRSCDGSNAVVSSIACEDSCAQTCELIENSGDCQAYGCEWYVSDACVPPDDGPRQPACIKPRELRCDPGADDECAPGQRCQAFQYDPCRGMDCDACAAVDYWCQ